MNFDHMFRTIHGYEPFPWQAEAAHRLTSGEKFNAVNVPTASGKTSMIDAAVFAAAHGGARRIAFIIDRRVVVDEAYNRAQRIANALSEPALDEFNQRIGPIQVVRLRGGVHGDDDWVLYPERVTVLVSTVDQIGSRLLHRGYGVSTRMAPLHAGFVGNDALYIVDEAHISTPFIQTVQASCRYGANVRMITMTATPTETDVDEIRLSKEDTSHPVLKKRLKSSKKARLLNSSDAEKDFVKIAAAEAQNLVKDSRVIGVVVNRVDSARRIQKALIKQRHRAELLTGRIRPYDRDQLMARLFPEIRAGRNRTDGEPIFIVATQTVEVGADIDFDSLITEAAPLDSLRQRFGRLDRMGEIRTANAVIIYRDPKRDKKGSPVPDPIYGMAIHHTWEWLKQVAQDGVIDFGITELEKIIKKKGQPPPSEPAQAPALLPPHIRLLSQTGPDAPRIDISAWLHGAGNRASDVSIIWRSDLPIEDPSSWNDIVKLQPPLTRESLEIPLYAAQSWLLGLRQQYVTDIEGANYLVSVPRSQLVETLPVLRWRGPDDIALVSPRDIQTGDTLIVPSLFGGCDDYGWNPNSKNPVTDVAEYCRLDRGKYLVIRLVPNLTNWLGSKEKQISEAVTEVIAAETELVPEFGVDKDRVQFAHSTLRSLLAEIKHPFIDAFKGKFEIERYPMGIVLRGRIIDEVNATLHSGARVELQRHLEGVTRKIELIADGHHQLERLKTAAKLHDKGKAEHRFQVMLYGNPIDAAAGPLLAKSGMRKLSEIYAAYAQADIPKGFRHELASLSLSNETDRLVRYLVGSHHGFGRPWFPPCADPDAHGVEVATLGSGWIEAFSALKAELGPWTLAEMELLLRASDARQSIAEQEEFLA